MTVQTYRGRDLTVSVGYRLPLDAYQVAERYARERGVKLSVILREATMRGLGAGNDGDGRQASPSGNSIMEV